MKSTTTNCTVQKKCLGEQIQDYEADWKRGLHETDETYL